MTNRELVQTLLWGCMLPTKTRESLAEALDDAERRGVERALEAVERERLEAPHPLAEVAIRCCAASVRSLLPTTETKS